MSQVEFGRAGGVRAQAQSKYESGERSPDARYFALVSELGVDVAYVITSARSNANAYEPGTVGSAGGVVGGRNDAQSRASDQPLLLASRSVGTAHVRDDCAEIPVYDVEASAGGGAVVLDESPITDYPLPRSLIANQGWQIDQLLILWARGDSMPGVVENGRPVLVDRSYDQVRGEGIYVLLVDEHLMIKAVTPNHRGDLTISSTNKAYRDIHVPRNEVDQVRVIGRAVWTDLLL